MYTVYQHWDPLRVCVVGRSYPPEFYAWITNSRVRDLFERIAIETEEDFQHIITTLERFGVTVLRPDLPDQTFFNGRHIMPPMTPRDGMIMIGDRFFVNGDDWQAFYQKIRDQTWPIKCLHIDELEPWQQQECRETHGWNQFNACVNQPYHEIFQQVTSNGNRIEFHNTDLWINGAMTTRIGRDLYHGTTTPDQDIDHIRRVANRRFPQYRNHVVDTAGHSDGTYCAVTPGLIISLYDVPTYADTFPGWEVVYLPGQSWAQVKPFLDLKRKNLGKWWIPGFEYDDEVTNVIETWLTHWTGYVEETVFDVNMLIIDPKNVMVFNHNDKVFQALERHGITPHVVPFRHRYFWDGGIHCVTLDLDRVGKMQDWFPQRSL